MSNRAYCWVALCLTLLVIVCREASADGENSIRLKEHGLPSCGIMSAFGMLRMLSRDIVLSDVEHEFRKCSPDPLLSEVSIREMRVTLSAFAMKTDAIRYSTPRQAQIPCPAVLFFQKGRWTTEGKGHFLLLAELNNEHAHIVDWWSGGPIDRIVPRDDLLSRWGGEAIVVQGSWPAASYSRSAIWIWVGILALVAFVILQHRVLHHSPSIPGNWMRSVPPAGLMAISLLSFSGCGTSAVPSNNVEPMLRFTQPVANLGNVDGPRVDHAFEFTVWETEPVTITKVESSCGCTTVGDELIGQELAPGSHHTLTVTVRVDAGGVKEARLITVRTKPATPTPIIVVMEYKSRETPLPTPSQIQLLVHPGAIATTELRLVHRRAEKDSQILVDRSKSEGNLFTLDKLSIVTEKVIDPGSNKEITEDTTTLVLKMKSALGYGTHEGQFVVSFRDGSSKTVPTFVLIPLPLRPKLKRIFAGKLAAGESWKSTIRCDTTGPHTVPVAAVRCTDENVHASLSKDDWSLHVEGVAPEKSGRFSGEITIEFSNETIPNLVIPYAGVVD